jgi:hypothetical protein
MMFPNRAFAGVPTGPWKISCFTVGSMAEVWTLFDNSGKIPKMIALERDKTIRIIDKGTYAALVKRYGRT